MKYTLILLLLFTTLISSGQSYLYFQDSPDANLYDFSWMELTTPSELERKGEDLRKFPVESAITPQQGLNCLRLKWRSATEGNWVAIAAGDGWTAHNISDTDTLVFWLQSIEGISSANLPKIFMEDVSNTKSIFLSISDYHGDLAAGAWTRINIPMSGFLSSGDGVDYTKIKTIGFAQGVSDAAEHSLLVDNMRVFKGSGTAPPVAAPSNLTAEGYEYHVELGWDLSPDEEVSAYQIERSTDGGSNFTMIAPVDETENYYIDWVKSLGTSVNLSYRVRALNEVGDPSDPSNIASASTAPMSDDELLDMVQEYTFRYFWDYAHEASGMSLERNTSGNTVTSGGSGFGIMAIPVGIEREYITREEGVERTLKMLNFLSTCDRFHGAWSHWINGNTGKMIPFSTKDNGGDIVETAYMAEGLLTIRAYFTQDNADEKEIVRLASELWEGIEWDWYRKNDSPSIYWHWSPEYNWDMNMTVSGWNEAAIVYLLAVASPTHGVPASLWETGWAKSPNYTNGKKFYGHELYVGPDYGGPLFFAHYSFVGFDPRDKADMYANYFEQNRNHSLIHQRYCKSNLKGFAGYSENCWGLTASDDPDGYMAHEPNSDRDNGTITPTAALSSFPYTPSESMLALKHFYRELGDKTWGKMGFYDAFNETRNWFATSYLAIDQGPILLMIENQRSQLLWDLFMSNPEIQPMLDAIGFVPDLSAVDALEASQALSVFPNPSSGDFELSFQTSKTAAVQVELYTKTGEKVRTLLKHSAYPAGEHHILISGDDLVPGLYLARLLLDNRESAALKLIVN